MLLVLFGPAWRARDRAAHGVSVGTVQRIAHMQ
jgi:hypothetical protein